jgi:hypothetical protein
MVYEFLGLLVESYGTLLLLQRLVDASKDSDIPKNVPFAFAINNRNTLPLRLFLFSSGFARGGLVPHNLSSLPGLAFFCNQLGYGRLVIRRAVKLATLGS